MKAGGAIIFDEPYDVEDESVQGEVYFCKTHVLLATRGQPQ
jgi:hypothetical protein